MCFSVSACHSNDNGVYDTELHIEINHIKLKKYIKLKKRKDTLVCVRRSVACSVSVV